MTDSTGVPSTDLLRPFLSGLWPLLVLLPAVLALRIALDRVERSARQRRLGTLEERLQRAAAAMRDTRELLDGVEAELTARRASLDRLTKEVEEWETLAALRRTEAAAVTALVRSEVSRGGRVGLWQGAVINAIFFAAGFIIQQFLR